MLATGAETRFELSTSTPRASRRADNRAMTNTTPGDGLVRFLTLADTAEILSISAKQAYALVRSGELRAIKVGASGTWRVERAELEAYIAAMYEQTRRMRLWHQSDYSNVTEFSRGETRTR